MEQNLASRLRDARAKSGHTQLDAARFLDCEPQSISNWERSVAEPSREDLLKLAEFYAVSYSWLAGAAPKEDSLDARLELIPLEDREFAAEQAKRVLNKWMDKSS
jgi:transcriptional regulator with XRE-family HTH domain